jgi:hypothetical protein
VALTSRRETGEALALFRICVGVGILLTVGWAVLADLVGAIWLGIEHGGYRELTSHPHWVRWLGGLTPGLVWTLVVISLAGGACLVTGFGGRLSAAVTWQALWTLLRINTLAGGDYELLLSNSLWLLVLGDGCATWSLDCKLRTGRWSSDRTVGAWARYLVITQCVIMYTTTGLQKSGGQWTPAGDFSALYFVLRDITWNRVDLPWLGSIYGLTQLATASSWLFEISWALLPLVLYARATGRTGGVYRWLNRYDLRWCFVLGGLLLHAGITLALEVATFGWVSISFYPCLFAPAELRRWAERGASRLRGLVRSRVPAPATGVSRARTT